MSNLKNRAISLIFILSSVSLSLRSEDIGRQGWEIVADGYSSDYTGVPVASGMLGILPWQEPFSVKHVMMNHVFERMGQDKVNSVLGGICPFGLEMKCDGETITAGNISGWKQTIDMRNAEHITEFMASGKAQIRYSFVALRNMPYSILMNVGITAIEDVDIECTNRMTVPDGYRNTERERRSFPADGHGIELMRTSAETLHGRYRTAASAMYIHDSGFERSGDDGQDILKASMKAGQTLEFTIVGAVCSTCDFTDPWNEADRQLVFIERETVTKIMEAHRRLWAELWQGDIEIEGDTEAQLAVRLALFNLYGFCIEGSRLSISPMGLSSNGYNGHIFWDTELWMYPPMLMLNQGIARSMIDYRYDRLDAARSKAVAYGYKGAMFPWESDRYGEESTPVWAITGPMEHHITADIGIAAWNYWRVTRDRKWLKEQGWEMMKAIADFWTSRVRRNEDGSYSIAGVVGADEYAQNVTDNAFTNASAATVLRFASDAARECGVKAPEEWSGIASGLRILTDGNGVTMNYEGYSGQMTKQADVNLLGYPLSVITDRKQLIRDLEYYEDRIDPVNGPAMSFSVFAIQYARMGDAAKAEQMFRKSYRPNMRPPFGALAETPASHNPYFATAAGGLLQAVLNGFAGLEITDKGIRQHKPLLPPSWKKLTVRGVGPDRRTYVIENK